MLIRVTDDGMGMNEDRLKEVTEGLKDSNLDSKAIYGLYNVNERIRLGFGEEYGINIESDYGKGSIVTIRLPKILTTIVEK